VIPALKLARGFDADDAERFFHDANDAGVAARIGAVNADLAVADVVAHRAQAKLIPHVENSLGQVLGVVAAGAQHVKRDALRGFLPDAGQALFPTGISVGTRHLPEGPLGPMQRSSAIGIFFDRIRFLC
jgi:hypothetical protein